MHYCADCKQFTPGVCGRAPTVTRNPALSGSGEMIRHWFWYWPSECPGGWLQWAWWRVGDGTWRVLGAEHHP